MFEMDKLNKHLEPYGLRVTLFGRPGEKSCGMLCWIPSRHVRGKHEHTLQFEEDASYDKEAKIGSLARMVVHQATAWFAEQVGKATGLKVASVHVDLGKCTTVAYLNEAGVENRVTHYATEDLLTEKAANSIVDLIRLAEETRKRVDVDERSSTLDEIFSAEAFAACFADDCAKCTPSGFARVELMGHTVAIGQYAFCDSWLLLRRIVPVRSAAKWTLSPAVHGPCAVYGLKRITREQALSDERVEDAWEYVPEEQMDEEIPF